MKKIFPTNSLVCLIVITVTLIPTLFRWCYDQRWIVNSSIDYFSFYDSYPLL